MCELASTNKIYIIFGIYELDNKTNDTVYNTVVVVNKNGEIITSYRKTHLCDSWNIKESSKFNYGDKKFEVIDTDIGKIGLVICYELRFPEISRYLALSGADILFVPSAWYQGPLKEDHWETLLKARAIENTLFICSSNQIGESFTAKNMIIDPMGVVLASGNEEEQLVSTHIYLNRIQNTRKKNPSLENRRTDLK